MSRLPDPKPDAAPDSASAEANRWPHGCLQVYTGDGKGKTTAALGLALRAAGAGMHVYIAQFMKGRDYSELHALRRLSPGIEVRRFGLRHFLVGVPTEEDRAVARSGLEAAREVLVAGNHDLVILDEANVAVDMGLFAVDDLLAVVDARPCAVELVVTGRKAHPRLIERADLVTEMREIKHYYRCGLPARTGIEE
mgnify:CR=1 FL=1